MDLKLRDLEPRFFRCDVGTADECHGRQLDDGTMQWGGFAVDINTPVSTLGEADGMWFYCPKCWRANGGPVGSHQVMVCFEGKGAPPHIGKDSSGNTVRWSVRGNDFFDLTLSPSIHVKVGCGWHGFVEHGKIRDA